MTDHFIRRDPPGANLLAPLAEVHDSPRTEYRGEVVLLYPNRLPPTKETELALALGQVVDGANYARGIPRLRAALDAAKLPQAEFYFELANAYSRTDRSVEGLPYYREALRIDPRLPGAARTLNLLPAGVLHELEEALATITAAMAPVGGISARRG